MPNLGLACADAVRDHLKAQNLPKSALTHAMLAAIVNDRIAPNWRPKREQSAPRKVNVLGKGLSDEQWFAQLEADPKFAGVAVRDEVRRCRIYFSGGGEPSRARILRWLAKADVKMPVRSAALVPLPAIPEPDDWRGLLRDDTELSKYTDPAYYPSWSRNIGPATQRRIVSAVERITAAQEQQRRFL
jgi:hypothetical protein